MSEWLNKHQGDCWLTVGYLRIAISDNFNKESCLTWAYKRCEFIGVVYQTHRQSVVLYLSSIP